MTRRTLFILFLFTFVLEAQTQTNLEKFFGLVDESAEEIIGKLKLTEMPSLNFYSPDEYSLLKNRVLKAFKESSVSNESGSYKLNYQIVNASVEYPEIFRAGFLGRFLVNRKVNLNVDYTLEKGGEIVKTGSFVKSVVDTVEYERVNSLENFSVSFTRGQLPPEPLFSGLIEPVVAIGTAVVAVYLLFTVRGN